MQMCIVLSVNTQNELILQKIFSTCFLVFSVVRVSYFRCTIIGLYFFFFALVRFVVLLIHSLISLIHFLIKNQIHIEWERQRDAKALTCSVIRSLWVLMNYSLHITMKNRSVLTSAFQLLNTCIFYTHTHTFGVVGFWKFLTNDNNFRFLFLLTLVAETLSKLFQKWVCWRFDRFSCILYFNWESNELRATATTTKNCCPAILFILNITLSGKREK